MTDQLVLFEAASNRAATKAAAGLAKEIAPGAERLLAALVKHGLDREFLRPAAALVLELDRPPNGDGHDADEGRQ